ncbi:NAD(P)-binding protein [Lentinula detonsa]|uniref:NAD(P)-binding protein n=1 Tax=Lentinula detonsa TaxID=2804962 RepID=A0AA38QBC0_9AGAR|nr:NAD(P)-binding protein [Lentinula detonsa]
MPSRNFFLVTPSTRGLSLALTRNLLRTTDLPVFATYRRGKKEEVKEHILKPFNDSGNVDPTRLKLLYLDLLSENSIEQAAKELEEEIGIEKAFLTGGILYPEKSSADLKLSEMMEAFQTNVISHLLLIKHFSKFLPKNHPQTVPNHELAKWVHISARVGSISDNVGGGWYSYRASKAALNQVIKTFDLQLQMKKTAAMCVGIHPGTMRTELSKDFWKSSSVNRLFDPEDAAKNIVDVLQKLNESKRGKIWDWKGEEILP